MYMYTVVGGGSKSRGMRNIGHKGERVPKGSRGKGEGTRGGRRGMEARARAPEGGGGEGEGTRGGRERERWPEGAQR
jgi:hypothetical protein